MGEFGDVNALLVAFAFPPKLDAEVLQTSKLHKYLGAAASTDLHVVTSRETASPLSLVWPTVKVALGKSVFDLFTSRLLNFLWLRLFPGWASRPDIKSHAMRSWRAVARSLPWRPDIVISRSYPISAALMGQKLAEHFQVPWIMQLSDPWALSPLHPKGYDSEWNTAREEQAFKRADLITFTSQRTMSRYAQRYPWASARLRYFPNTFDPDDIRENPWTKKAQMRLVYAGTLGGSRSPDALFAAIEAFLVRCPEARTEIEVVIAGHASRSVRRYLSQRASYLKFLGPVGFKESMTLIRSSDVLVLIDNLYPPDVALTAGAYEFFPSKLLDYMLARRPILAISDSESIASGFVLEQGLGRTFTHGDTDGLALELERRWRLWRLGDKRAFEVDAQTETYDARQNALRLRSEIERLVHGH